MSHIYVCPDVHIYVSIDYEGGKDGESDVLFQEILNKWNVMDYMSMHLKFTTVHFFPCLDVYVNDLYSFFLLGRHQ